MEKIELIKKIKELADKGIGGEKENAQAMLERLMKENNISENDLNDDTINSYEIKYGGYKSGELLAQVFYSVCGELEGRRLYTYGKFSKRGYMMCDCTASEFVEFDAKYKFYKYYFDKEIKQFYKAFIQANCIFPSQDKVKSRNINREVMSQDDIDVLKMASNLDKHLYNLQIE